MYTKSFFVILLLFFPVQSQQTSTPNEKQLKIQRQRAQAISMIEQIANEALLWDDKRSAVDGLANAADMLWDANPNRAAKWLSRAWELIDQIGEGEQNPAYKEFRRESDKAQYQSLVLRVAHSHDAKLADKFVAQLSDKTVEEKKDRGAFDDRTARSEQLLRLARQAVDSNPQLAFTLAQRSLSDGVSFSLQDLLTSLRKKDGDLSNRLFDLALTRFTSGVAEPSEAEVLAGYLFQPGLTFSSNAAGQVIMVMNPIQRNEPAVSKTEPQRARGFLVAAYQAFFTRPLPLESPPEKQRAQRIWVFGNRSLPRYESLAPEFLVPTKAYLVQLESKLFPEGRGDPFRTSQQSRETAPRSEKEIYEARIATLEERAEKTTDPVARDLAYVDAALAPDAQDYQRAKSIAEKISDETLRADAIAFVLYRAALAFSGKKDFEKATELALQIANLPRRALVKLAIAQALLASKAQASTEPAETKVEEQRALDLLNELEREIRKEDISPNTAKILLARAALLAKLDNDQALIGLQQAFQAINKLERFELKNSSAPRLGIKGAPRSETLADAPRAGFSLRNALEPLIETEFENLTNLTDSLKVREVRGLARLEIARLYLEKTK